MADDVLIVEKASAGAGETAWSIASDDVGGRQFQTVKLDVGADGVSVPVTGALPVSGPLTDAQLRATAVPVSGSVTTGGLTDTQLRATPVPISGTITANVGTGTQPVSGTITANAGTGPFPVSDNGGSLTIDSPQLPAALAANGGLKIEGVASGVAVPVSGTFFQATQPVSIATNTPDVTDRAGRLLGVVASITASVAVTGPLTDTQLRATPVPVSGTVTANAGTGPFPVSDNAGSLTVDAPVGTPVFVRLSDGTAAIATLPVSLATNTPDVTDRAGRALGVVASITAAVTITPPTLTKGTQGATGLSVQRLNDAGRNGRIFMLDTITAAPVADALATVVQWYGNAAVAGTTQPAVVPTGKVLRLTTWKIQYQSLATVGYAVVRVRVNTAGLVVIGSPLVFSFEAGSGSGATTVAMTGGVTTETGDFPEGFEIPAAAGIGFSVAGYGPTGTLTLEGGVRFLVAGYEY